MTSRAPLMPTVTEMMHATGEVKGTKAMPKARESKDDEPGTLAPTAMVTMHATCEVRGTKAMPRVKKSDGDDARDVRGERHQGDAEGEEIQRRRA